MTRVRRAREEDISRARRWMTYVHTLGKDHLPYGWEALDDDDLFDAVIGTPISQPGITLQSFQAQNYEEWDLVRVETYIREERRVILLIDGWVVDVTKYLSEHVGV